MVGRLFSGDSSVHRSRHSVRFGARRRQRVVARSLLIPLGFSEDRASCSDARASGSLSKHASTASGRCCSTTRSRSRRTSAGELGVSLGAGVAARASAQGCSTNVIRPRPRVTDLPSVAPDRPGQVRLFSPPSELPLLRFDQPMLSHRRLIARISAPVVVRKILAHLGHPTKPPRPAPRLDSGRSREQLEFA